MNWKGPTIKNFIRFEEVRLHRYLPFRPSEWRWLKAKPFETIMFDSVIILGWLYCLPLGFKVERYEHYYNASGALISRHSRYVHNCASFHIYEALSLIRLIKLANSTEFLRWIHPIGIILLQYSTTFPNYF